MRDEQPILVLASASSSRASLLKSAGVDIAIAPANVDEAAIKKIMLAEGGDAASIALALAEEKARVISRDQPGALVIGADQILVCGGQLYDKPPDMAAAAQHLAGLQGKAHDLATAAVVVLGGKVIWQNVSSPHLTMRGLSGPEIARYLKHTGPKALESVGAYQLEGLGATLFDDIDGDFFTILGLPLLPLLAFLRARDISLP